MNTEQKCDCCGWDDNGYSHEPQCATRHTEQKGWREELSDFAIINEMYVRGFPMGKLESFIERTLQQQKQQEQRCGKDNGDGSICGCILDCHLHDWRQKEALLAYQEELVKKCEAQKDNLLKDVLSAICQELKYRYIYPDGISSPDSADKEPVDMLKLTDRLYKEFSKPKDTKPQK